MKINQINTISDIRPCKFTSKLDWAKLIYKQGVKPGQRLVAANEINNLTYKSISSNKLLVDLNLLIITRPKRQEQVSQTVNISWKQTLRTIPEQKFNINTNKIIEKPQYLSKIFKIKKIIPVYSKITAKTITNRIALKGKNVIEVHYIPQL